MSRMKTWHSRGSSKRKQKNIIWHRRWNFTFLFFQAIHLFLHPCIYISTHSSVRSSVRPSICLLSVCAIHPFPSIHSPIHPYLTSHSSVCLYNHLSIIHLWTLCSKDKYREPSSPEGAQHTLHYFDVKPKVFWLPIGKCWLPGATLCLTTWWSSSLQNRRLSVICKQEQDMQQRHTRGEGTHAWLAHDSFSPPMSPNLILKN